MDWGYANSLFENLGDPWYSYNFVGSDGQVHSLSTAELLKLNRVEWNEAQTELRNLLSELTTANMISDTPSPFFATRPDGEPLPMGVCDPLVQGFDRRMNSEVGMKSILSTFPWNTDVFALGPVDGSPPIPRGFSAKYITQNLINKTTMSDDHFVDVINRAVSIINRLHAAANANPALSPAVFIALNPSNFQPIFDFTSQVSSQAFATNSRLSSFPCADRSNNWRGKLWLSMRSNDDVSGYDDELTRHAVADVFSDRLSTMLPSRLFHAKAWWVDVSNSVVRTISDERMSDAVRYVWTESLHTRQRSVVYGPAVRSTGAMILADAVYDMAALVQLLTFLSVCPPHALLQSCMQWHYSLLQTSFKYMSLTTPTFGSDPDWDRYVAGIETQKAMQQSLSARMGTAFGTGFQTGNSILTGNTEGTLPLAVAGATRQQAGAALGVAVGTVAAFIAASNRQPDPVRTAWRETLSNRLNATYCDLWKQTYYWNITPEKVITGSPVKDWR